jgi:hypothetical protein
MRVALLLAALLACSSCSVVEQPSGLIPRWTTAWKQVASEDDRQRLMEWRTTFVGALDAARKAGHGAEITREGALLDPDVQLLPAGIPDGMYRCRIIKIGAKLGTTSPAYLSGAPGLCRVKQNRDLQRFNKFGGQQRYVGLIFPDDAVREVFLGTLVLGDETRALQYGQDELRDVAGYVEHIGPGRWRLLLPKPHFESQFDVIELTASGAVAAAVPTKG